MRTSARKAVIAAILVLGLVPLGALTAFGGRSIDAEFPVSVAPGGQVQPDADWPYVAYKDGRYDSLGVGNGEPHVRVYNMVTGRDFPVTPENLGLWEQANPSVSGTRVVYSDQRNYAETECDVWMYDIATGEETVVCDGPNGQGNPFIYGDTVAWVDWRNSRAEIWMKDLSTGEMRAVAPGPGNQREPVVWENYISWRDDRMSDSGGWNNVYLYDIASDEATCVAESVRWSNPNPPYQYSYIDFYDPHVADGVVVFNAYINEFDGSTYTVQDSIWLYDIEADDYTVLRSDAPGNCWHPVVADGWVTWTDYRNGANEVWGYDLTNEEEALLVAAEMGATSLAAPESGEKLTLEEAEAAAELKATQVGSWFKYAGRSYTDAGWVYWHDHRPWDGDDSSADLYAKYLGTGNAPTQKMPLQGGTRYQTAIEVSRQGFPEGSSVVVVTTGKNWPDALTGAPLAAVYEAPILLIDTALPAETSASIAKSDVAWQVPSDVADEIERLGAERAIILGGERAVPPEVEQALADQFGMEVMRIGGANRFETASLVAEAIVDELGDTWSRMAFVTTGRNFPDALAASPLAASARWPIFLADSTGLSPETEQVMSDLGVWQVVVLGGSVAVPLEVGSQVAALGVGESERIGGRDRYETAALIADYGVVEMGMRYDVLGMATGSNFPDGLTLGAALGQDGFTMMLTASQTLPTNTRLALEANKDEISQMRYAGGTAAISKTVRDAIAACLH